ncbi:beta-ketoacyl synthase N-terminal-like domain-containing protein [Streptomyces sp. NPDC051546]|uniref:beta-ketoacyl synthase N-terminal-like domain-containing protein n=1 Tax=Streptomyces sp. NPDC051546 TaxID=3365655 RepID=UPI00378E8EF1
MPRTPAPEVELTMSFAPIAVVGRGCALPGALHPDALWDVVMHGRSVLSAPPAGRCGAPADSADRPGSGSGFGGYVTGFEEVFDPAGLHLPAAELALADPGVRWTLHAVGQCLREAGAPGLADRSALVLGHLFFPTDALTDLARATWSRAGQPSEDRTDPDTARGRFAAAAPALTAARAFGLGAGAFTLDAACASSLYAVKLACDRLHSGQADLVVAGGVNRCDSLFVHLGFQALGAISPSGSSRPFHRLADGLVPSEGAAAVALMRLEDALARGLMVHGVIRGVGLGNDGQGRGLLVPHQEGQVRAMRLAYRSAGVRPESVGLLECHATGTPKGDAVEVAASAEVFPEGSPLPVGSLKSNFGHLITAAGAAGLLKLLHALRAGVLPPSRGADQLPDALVDGPLRVLSRPEPWTGPRRAAISAFGFGGNNAHLVLDSLEHGPDDLQSSAARPKTRPTRPALGGSPRRAVAVVSLGTRVATGEGVADFTHALLTGTAPDAGRTDIRVDLTGLRFPPQDLADALPQHVLVLEAAREAVHELTLPAGSTMVVVGQGCDAEGARHGVRLRDPDGSGGSAPPLDAAAVVGMMGNVTANRISAHLGLTGPSFAVAAEEGSGIEALRIAAEAVSTGEADCAVVGAVDLSVEPVHQAAADACGLERPPGDAAVVLVLKDLERARQDGDRVLAVLADPRDEGLGAGGLLVGDPSKEGNAAGLPCFDPASLFGSAHSALGLLAVACGILALYHRARPRTGQAALPWPDADTVRTHTEVFGGRPTGVVLRAADSAGWTAGPPPRLHVFSGRDRAQALDALARGTQSPSGPARIVIAASGPSELHHRAAALRTWLASGGPRPRGTAFQSAPLGGELAFVFTGGAAAYPGMGNALALALPELPHRLHETLEGAGSQAAALTEHGAREATVLSKVLGSSWLSQLHALVSTDVLGLRPTAALGYSSGENNALIALGAWPDGAGFVADTRASSLLTRDLVGEFTAVREQWRATGITGTRWRAHLVGVDAERVREALVHEPAVHLMAVNAPGSCTVGGEEEACLALLRRLDPAYSLPLEYEVAVHAPVLAGVRDTWHALHLRPTDPVPGVRFYTCGTATAYTAESAAVADALTVQALGTVDFRGTVEQAWRDGVRVFLEHGPRALCTGWIDDILQGREHLALALDAGDGQDVDQLFDAAAQLVAAGAAVDVESLHGRFPQVCLRPPAADSVLVLPAHPPAMELRPARGPVAPHVLRRPPAVQPAVDTALLAPGPGPGPDIFLPAPRTTAPAHAMSSPAPSPTEPSVIGAIHRQAAAAHVFVLGEADRAHRGYLDFQEATVRLLLDCAPPAAGTSLPREPSARGLPGVVAPLFDRATLEYLSHGRISEVFGPLFASQDGWERQTRMPRPPMLLTDEVLSLDGEAGSMGTGVIRTRTTVRTDSWYLDPAGRMPAGLMLEAGQADLLLISWLGADCVSGGERVYRLLGCEVTFHGPPPAPGEVLDFEISIDGHAEHDGIRLFFFRYDCHVAGRLRLSLRQGQAGFFTDRELADTGGVLWDPALLAPDALHAPGSAGPATGSRFGPDEIRAFADGDAADCFGPGWRATRAHLRTPRIADGRMLLIDEVSAFDPAGGPLGRGYLRAELPLSPTDWFFDGHFHNDPCMPGTLMLEGALQAMAVHLSALGATINRDGWRFEPAPDVPVTMRCRGQVTPQSRQLTYEVFVTGFEHGPCPTLTADLLCTVDGVKAFHAGGVRLRLVPDWPLEHWRELAAPSVQADGAYVEPQAMGGLRGFTEPRPVARTPDGLPLDLPSLLAFAWGRPSDALGSAVAEFDGPRRMPRLPGPPFQFTSRVTKAELTSDEGGAGSRAVIEYDAQDRAWYREQNGNPTMPFSAMLETVLQACGWLANAVGPAASTPSELMFRNLDGTLTLAQEALPGTRVLRTEVDLLGAATDAGTTLHTFAARCWADGQQIIELSTTFGFFPPEAFTGQSGLPVTEEDRARLMAGGSDVVIDLRGRPLPSARGALRLPGPMLLMVDRITGYWPQGGRAGLGRVQGEKTVDPGEWFFPAHFFQDPVQPGSLGLEAMCQLLQFHLIEQDAGAGLTRPRFEPLMTGRPVSWTYRGQVTPASRLVTVEAEVTSGGRDARGPYVLADAWLWADGLRIYYARDIGMRVVSGP